MRTNSTLYKCVIFDVDGTLIPSKDALPSIDIKRAIMKARDNTHIALATSRSYARIEQIAHYLELTDPCVVLGGSRVIDPVQGNILWEQQMLIDDLHFVARKAIESGLQIIVADEDNDCHYSDTYIPVRPQHVWVMPTSEENADAFMESISHIPTIYPVKTSSVLEPGKTEMIITHSLATKSFAVREVAAMLHIRTSEIIGVGDGYNDISLLQECGLKVAMDNAVDALKEIADYIAPSVYQDGAAAVLKKFILEPSIVHSVKQAPK